MRKQNSIHKLNLSESVILQLNIYRQLTRNLFIIIIIIIILIYNNHLHDTRNK